MPHYKDGAEAKVGDFVRGKPYNVPHEVAGTLVSITPGVDTCNCTVEFTEVLAAEKDGMLTTDPNFKYDPKSPRFTAFVKGERMHRTAEGKVVTLLDKQDYGEVKAFELVSRPGAQNPES